MAKMSNGKKTKRKLTERKEFVWGLYVGTVIGVIIAMIYFV